MKTAILKCDCKHEYQDEKYGKSLRVHNETAPKGNTRFFRCTVCGSKKSK